MSENGESFKIFVAKLNPTTTPTDLRTLFEKYGKVVECDVVKNFGFVHMSSEVEGKYAIEALNGITLKGQQIKVEASKKRKGTVSSGQPTTKIYVGNLPNDIQPPEVRELFGKYGSVVECDLIQNYGFVHIDTDDLTKLLNELNGMEYQGQKLKVQISTSRIRPLPGMGSQESCYKCGRQGHWSKECPKFGLGPKSRPQEYPVATRTARAAAVAAADLYGRGMYPPPPPTASSYMSRDRMLSYAAYRDMYERYLDHTIAASRYDDYAAGRSMLPGRTGMTPGPISGMDYASMYGHDPTAAVRYPLPTGEPSYDGYDAAAAAAAAAAATSMVGVSTISHEPYYYDDKRMGGYGDDRVDRGDRLTNRYAPY